MRNDPTPTIVLAIDGLRAAALGAYGQTSYETPAFDALTAESVVYDWCHAATPDTADLYDRLRVAVPSDSMLVSDDLMATGLFAEAFAKVHWIEVDEPTEVAESIEQTTLAATWESIAEQTVQWADQENSRLLWIHTKGLYGPWDGPPALYESLLDEEDAEIEPSIQPSDTTLEDVELAEAALEASCRYAGQMITLDACLAGWLDIVDGLLEGRDYRLLVVGARGYPLGEHGRVGGVDHRLFSEQQQVPFVFFDSTSSQRFTRKPSPITLEAVLNAVLAGRQVQEMPAQLRSSNGDRAILTKDWMLRVPGEAFEAAVNSAAVSPLDRAELYVKPDDRWEQNDIASLEEQAAADLLAALLSDESGGHDSGVAETSEHS